jgi:hypothetical protein
MLKEIIITFALSLFFCGLVYSAYGYHGYYEEEEEILPERNGWCISASAGGSFGEIAYGFNSPFIGVSFNLRKYVDSKQWIRFGITGSYFRSIIDNEYMEFRPPFYNNKKDQFYIAFTNDFFLLHKKRVSPWVGYGTGLFYIGAKGKYIYEEQEYDPEEGWSVVFEEEREAVIQSVMMGIMLDFGVRIIISESVDLEGYVNQSFGLKTLSERILYETKGSERIYKIYRVPTAETLLFAGFVFHL